jgi:hypothetical protein
MTEPEVVKRVHSFLRAATLWEHKVGALYTDAHSTLLPFRELEPFQRFTLDLGDFAVHPDLVAALSDGESLIAVEAKGSDDIVRGLGQASLYRAGFHYSFLAASAGSLGNALVDAARRQNIGVIAVGDTTSLVYLPTPALPDRAALRFVASQLDTAAEVRTGGTFSFNLPTHYLVWAVVMEPGRNYELAELPDTLGNYPIPRKDGWLDALAGARKLGLVRRQGNTAALTDIGGAAKAILPDSLETWSTIHTQAARGATLVDLQPTAGALLRLLLLRDSFTNLIVAGLRSAGGTAHFGQLAIICDQIDHARAPILFLKEEAIATLTDAQGGILWHVARGEDYRSQVFFQYKSILKHAGLLAPGRLGGSSTKGYDPTADVWQLRRL